MVKDQIKECWHQNVTQCHDTYVTEFLPSQEQKCEETFWKSCKIDFREMPYNYTMKQCHTPLVKMCSDSPAYGGGKPEIVCKTWFESECNTTYIETTPNVEDKPNTWCKKVPRKICAPDNCKMVAGPEQCNDKILVSTVQKPTEVCDLQPQQHCRLITKLTPHLLSKEVCKEIPKEVCHLALSGPKTVRKPITLKWCTRKDNEKQRIGSSNNEIPTYTPRNYLPPPPSPPKRTGGSPRPVPFPVTPPSYVPPPNNNFQVRSDSSPPQPPPQPQQEADSFSPAASSEVKVVTKFSPPPPKYFKKPANPNSKRKVPEAFQPIFQEQFKPAKSEWQSQSIQIPESFKAAVKEAGLLKEEKEQVAEEAPKNDPPGRAELPRSLPLAHPVSFTEDLSGPGELPGAFFRRRRK